MINADECLTKSTHSRQIKKADWEGGGSPILERMVTIVVLSVTNIFGIVNASAFVTLAWCHWVVEC